MSFRDQHGKVLPDISRYLVEWAIVDEDAYERITDRTLPRDPPLNLLYSKSPEKGSPQTMVVSCVLEVPRSEAARTTTELGHSPNIQKASYLPRLQMFAQNVTAGMDDLLQLKWMVDQLKALAVRHAKDRANCEDEIKLLAVSGWPSTHERVNSIRNALQERKLDVAAKLLAALPDED